MVGALRMVGARLAEAPTPSPSPAKRLPQAINHWKTWRDGAI